MADTWLQTTPLKDLMTMREVIMEPGVMTVEESGFLKRLSKEIERREESCQRAREGYTRALSQ